jgi:multicomponent Na+:H+ antiporter subunit G
MIVLRIVIDILFVIGGFFAIAGVIGMLRMPDSYCRMQASTNTTTLGSICVLLGVSLYGFFYIDSPSIGIKSLVIGLFIIFSNPVSSHAIARAAKRIRVDMLNTSGCDEYGRDDVQ